MTLVQIPVQTSERQRVQPPKARRRSWRWGLVLLALIIAVYFAYVFIAKVTSPASTQSGLVVEEVLAPSMRVGVGDQAHGSPDGAPLSGSVSVEPFAPAVSGQTVFKCLVEGQVTYTNSPCAPTQTNVQPHAHPLDAVPIAQRPFPVSGQSDRVQHDADCRFLSAEFSRLEYQFAQPLPPTVLDFISTRLMVLRAEAKSFSCTLPKSLVKPTDMKDAAEPPTLQERASG